MATITPEQNRVARRAARSAAARRRFAKWKAEMETWGCTVTIPESLTPPEQ